ncbi:chromosome partition protein Smc-like [Ptychodera flava]|uniref:chromosome partition protein Smc-like n=1 Tax=Ptychodera flava TaxID=63121 RepID=UPI003969F060
MISAVFLFDGPKQVNDTSNEPQLYHTYSRGREEVGFSDILRQEIERRNLLENMLEATNTRIAELERPTKEMQRSQADRITKLYDIVNNLVGKQERDGGTSEQNAARQTRLEEEFKSLKDVIAGLQLSIETKDREKDALVENKQALDEEKLNIRQENKKLTETLEKLTKENKSLQGKVMSLESTIFALKDEVRGQQSQVEDMKINGEELKSGMVKNAEVLKTISSNMPVLKELSQLVDKLQEMLKKADNFLVIEMVVQGCQT